jgi:hypothetical protein
MPAPPTGPNPFAEMQSMFDAVPGFIPYTIVGSIMGGLMAVVLIVAGVGLLRLRPWAWWACIVYSVYTILATIVNTVYTMAVVNPAMQQWAAEHTQPQGAPQMPMMWGGGMSNAITVFGGLFAVAYPIALLIVMFLPQVRAAFGRGVGQPRYPEEVAEEEDDLGPMRPRPSRQDDRYREGPQP